MVVSYRDSYSWTRFRGFKYCFMKRPEYTIKSWKNFKNQKHTEFLSYV